MDNNSFSRYRNIRSPIHSIDPITKFLAFILLTTSVFIATDWMTLTVVFSFVLVTSFLARVRIKSYFTMLFFLMPFYMMMLFFYWIAYFDIALAAETVAFLTYRLYIFLLIAIVFTSTTKEMEIASAIEFYITPLRMIKVPTYEISMVIMLAIRFIPLMFEDLSMIMIAQTSRGVNVYNGNVPTRIKGVFNSLLPMFVLAFKRSDDISNAMIIRGYQIGEKRSKFKKNKFKLLELASLLLTIALLAGIIYLGGM